MVLGPVPGKIRTNWDLSILIRTDSIGRKLTVGAINSFLPEPKQAFI
jgi:hypothetical protein